MIMYEYNDESIMSVQELMDTLRIGKNLAYQLLNAGIIKGFRIGRSWKIPRHLLDEFIINSAKSKYHYMSDND